MAEVSFTVPGDARGKGRPRASTRNGFAVLYTDDKTAAYENRVALAARDAMDGRVPMKAPVHMRVVVGVTPPKRASKRQRYLMLRGILRPAKKPDLSNILKAIEDGANAIVYADDAQIVSLNARKVYAEIAGVEVQVAEIAA